MQLLDLANELLEIIAQQLDRDKDISALAKASRRLFEVATPHLYRHNVLCSGCSALFWAAEKGELQVIRRAISAGVSITVPDLLRQAVMCRQVPVVELLLGISNEGIDAPGKDDWTALAWAAHNGDVASATLLLDNGANVEKGYAGEYTPLGLAAISGRAGVARLLLARGATTGNLESENWQPLSSAAWHGHVDVASILLDHGAAADGAEAGPWLPLFSAAHSGHKDVVRLLLDHGVDISATSPTGTQRGLTALATACDQGRSAVVELLLQEGADPSIASETGCVPIALAASSGHVRITELLISHGYHPSAVGDSDWSAISLASNRGYLEVVEKLVQGGADVNVPEGDERNPLLLAASGGHHRIVEYLVKHGARIEEWTSKDGSRAIHKAAGGGHLATTRILVDAGCSIDATTADGLTALHLAAMNEEAEVVMFLVDRGANVRAACNYGWTCLHLAAQGGSLEMLEMFLKAPGLDINQRDHDGRTPFFYACVQQHLNIMTELLRRGADRDIKDRYSSLPIFISARNGHRGGVKLLLVDAKGEPVPSCLDARDSFGRSIIWWTSRSGHRGIAADLRELAEKTGRVIDESDASVEPHAFTFASGECVCDICLRNSIHNHAAFYCTECDGHGKFLICNECKEEGWHCRDAEHTWESYECDIC